MAFISGRTSSNLVFSKRESLSRKRDSLLLKTNLVYYFLRPSLRLALLAERSFPIPHSPIGCLTQKQGAPTDPK